MNILQIRSEFRDNGPGTQAFHISNELIKRGHKVYAASSGGVMSDKFNEAGIKHFDIESLEINKRNIKNFLKSIFSVYKILDANEIDIVHAHNAASLYIAYIASKFIKRKVNFFHSCRGIELRKYFKWRNLIYLNYPATIFAVAEWTKEQLINIGVDKHKIIVTNNGVDISKYNFNKKAIYRQEVRSQYNIPYNSIVVGIVGAIGVKGHDELIKAFSKLYKDFPNVYLILVGGGDKLEAFKNLAQNLNVSERCVFTGMRMDSHKLHAAFDIFALPSYWGEMFPNVLLESMAYKNPLISTYLSGIPEIVTEEVGFLIEPKDTISLANKLRILLSDKELRIKMGNNGYKKLKNNYTISKVVDKIERAYYNQ
ncbi:glycosyltransferase [Gracilimonas amylolytica]|uniref:glycosyltransferase n=1 Tax=Gracilimonas amylolytica TaxID=1749045 RepID=UPI000CD9A3A3|nr:glycosyltransferase [Gracilimonas amylolytica]